MEVPYPNSDWRSPYFRQKVVAQIEEARIKAGTANTKSSNDMENHVYVKAKSREEYLSLVARLIIHFRDIHPMNALTNLTGVGGGPGGIGMGPRPTGAPVGGMGAMGQMQIGQHAMAGVAGNPQAKPQASTSSHCTPPPPAAHTAERTRSKEILFALAEKGKMSTERVDECHRAVTTFVVKGLHPLATVETPWFGEMIKTLNPQYSPPSRESLSNHLIPDWYNVEKENIISELKNVSKVAITTDGWSSTCQDRYLTVTAHYLTEGKMQQKVLKTKAVYKAQTVAAEEIGDILEEFGLVEKVVTVAVDNTADMDAALKKLHLIKLGCFAHTLNLGAQSLYTINSVAKWTAKIRDVIVWMKRSSMAETVLQEKQQILNLPQHPVLLDVSTRWNSLYLMLERFLEQYPAIQAAFLDHRLRKPAERDRLSQVTDEDFRKAEDFVKLMRVLYTSALRVSSENQPTCGQILPILQTLKKNFTVQDGDTMFVSTLKRTVWSDLSQRYQGDNIRAFLEEATALDPRFKHKLENDTVWDRVRDKVLAANTTETKQLTDRDDGERDRETAQSEEEKEEENPPICKRAKMTPLVERFADDDVRRDQIQSIMSIQERTDIEVRMYRIMPLIMTSEDPALWWWLRRHIYPLLSELASSYLCVQASSTPSERVFSAAGDTISPERSRVLAEKADMLIFLQKNC
uniref:E3 SUMO-protein ligase ZBED1-like n=1 Tax=Centroberyx gerrardi TaxID=166262 RepID=UPI003AB020EE